MNNLLSVLEWEQVKQQFIFFAKTDLGINKINNSHWINDHNQLIKQLNLVEDAYKEMMVNISPEFLGISDISKILKAVKILKTLSVNELYIIKKYLLGILELIRFYNQRLSDMNYLGQFFTKLPDVKNLCSQLDKFIDNDGNVKEDACPTLYNLYQKKLSIEKKINDQLVQFIDKNRQYLASNTVVYRNNRACVQVLLTYKNHFNGIIHAQSSSGQTIYLEPQQLVNLNNSYERNNADISQEIEKLLISFTKLLNVEYEMLFSSLEIVAEIDFAFLKAAWMIDNNGSLANINTSNNINIIKAGHPLINKKELVTNNFKIDNMRMVLITGPNTGGKSVFLKTIALVVMMSYFGYPILCQEADLGYISNILIDLGDQQSINDSLSTFSAHLKQIDYILKNVNCSSLVILDEIGSATDPSEGSALAIAIMEKLLEVNSISIITTHYQQLKTFGHNQKQILMASMEFDQNTLLPSYHFLPGIAGQSYALDIARSLKLNNQIIERALRIKKENQSFDQAKMEELEKKLNNIHQLEKELLENQLEIEHLKADYSNKLQTLENSKSEILEKYRDQLFINSQKLLKEGQLLIEDIKNSQTLENIHSKEKQLQQLINDFINDTYASEKEKQTINVGDSVKIISTNQLGVVVKLDKKKAVVLVNNFEVKVDLENIILSKRVVKTAKKQVKKSVSLHTVSSFNSECMLVGLRYEEAKLQLLTYIDQCIINRLNTGRIVHGHGSGVLREMVHKVLSKQKNVESFNLALPQEGGSGVTVVVFK